LELLEQPLRQHPFALPVPKFQNVSGLVATKKMHQYGVSGQYDFTNLIRVDCVAGRLWSVHLEMGLMH
jgi:hypothetical protein